MYMCRYAYIYKINMKLLKIRFMLGRGARAYFLDGLKEASAQEK